MPNYLLAYHGGKMPESKDDSLIKADDLDTAVRLAKDCPVLQGGASIEVCETFEAM